MKLIESICKLLVIVTVLVMMAMSILPVNKFTRDKVLIPDKGCGDVRRTLLLMRDNFEVDTVYVIVPENSYIRGTSLYVPANQRYRFIPILDHLKEYKLKDYSDVDSRVIRAMFYNKDIVKNRSTE